SGSASTQDSYTLTWPHKRCDASGRTSHIESCHNNRQRKISWNLRQWIATEENSLPLNLHFTAGQMHSMDPFQVQGKPTQRREAHNTISWSEIIPFSKDFI